MFRRKSSGSPPQVDGGYFQVDVVEELVEEGSALLSERFLVFKTVDFIILYHLQFRVSDISHLVAGYLPNTQFLTCSNCSLVRYAKKK